MKNAVGAARLHLNSMTVPPLGITGGNPYQNASFAKATEMKNAVGAARLHLNLMTVLLPGLQVIVNTAVFS